MKSKLWRVGLLSVLLSTSLVSVAKAQTTYTTTTTTAPARVTTTTYDNHINSTTPCPLSGNVSNSSSNISGWGVRQKTLVLEPGYGQFSIDNLGLWNTLVMNLINPTDKPLKFETTQRVGKEKAWVVPAFSERTVSMTYTNPFADEVKFLVTEDPSSAMARIEENQKTAWAACTKVESPAMPIVQPQTTYVVPVEPPKRSTVRGFW